ncbi:MAG: hypothetical protein JO165_02940 [Candidatus Eremiobacteraeota bacterium]|nr:hypothetical protein [Candidatus Eremiobacteraeota bacterium]
MTNRGLLLFIAIAATLVSLYDLYLALFGTGSKIFAWIFAVLMAAIAISSFRRLTTTP